MAVEFKTKSGEVTRTNAYTFNLKDIVLKPELNGRHFPPAIAEMVQNILKHGQLVPVLVRQDAGQPVLLDGFTRYRAIREINDKKLTPQPLKILATYHRGNEQDGFVAAIQTNRQRNEVTPIDDAYNIDKLKKFGMTDEDIAYVYFPEAKGDREKTKAAVKWVNKRVRYVELSPEAQAAVRDGRMKETAADVFTRMSTEDQKELVAKGTTKVADAKAKAPGKSKGPAKFGYADLKAALNSVWETGKIPGAPAKFETPQPVIDWIEGLLKKSGTLKD